VECNSSDWMSYQTSVPRQKRYEWDKRIEDFTSFLQQKTVNSPRMLVKRVACQMDARQLSSYAASVEESYGAGG